MIVSWNVRPLLERCLASILLRVDSSRNDCEIIVVDNASTDDSVQVVARRFPTVKLIAAERNLGFARGNNVGLGQATGTYLLLLNPDTEVVGTALSSMVDYMEAHPDIGVLGPRLLFPDGRTQPSRRRFPTLATALVESTVVQQWFPNMPMLRTYYVQDRSDDQEQDVDWLVGACLLVRRQAWEQVGPLDEQFFMYSEELDWCRRFKMSGWRVAYFPDAQIIHHEGQSSGQVAPARHIYFQTSKVQYFRKHHGPLVGEALRIYLLFIYAYQLGLEVAKWLVGHKRPLRRERIQAYRQVLRSGLRPSTGAQS